jgi:hypothetical protein
MIFVIVKSQIVPKNIVTVTGEEKVAIKSAIVPNVIITNLIVIQTINKFQIKNQKKKLKKINDIRIVFRIKDLLIVKNEFK